MRNDWLKPAGLGDTNRTCVPHDMNSDADSLIVVSNMMSEVCEVQANSARDRYPSMSAQSVIETQHAGSPIVSDCSLTEVPRSACPVGTTEGNEIASYVEVDASRVSAGSRAHLGDLGDGPGAAAPEADRAMADASNPGDPPGLVAVRQ